MNKDAYKYFRFDLNANRSISDIVAKKLTVELKNLNGLADMFFSFEDMPLEANLGSKPGQV